MAMLVFGGGSSHSPMLGTPPEQWDLRAREDARARHNYRGKLLTFDELVTLRQNEGITEQLSLEVWHERHARNQAGIDRLGKAITAARLDILIVVGDDQMEVFLDDNMPTFVIYNGKTLLNKKASHAHRDALPAGVAIAEWMNEPEESDQELQGAPVLANHLITAVMRDGFDVSVSSRMPIGRFGDSGIPHAFGFFYHRVLDDLRRDPLMATLPIFLNCFFPPNQPSARRALDFGKAIGRAITAWPGDQRIGIVASGGFSHFVVDEELDRRLLRAIERNDEATLSNEPDSTYQSGTSEIKNWITVLGAMSATGLRFNLIDYVPCYRSAAGTGNACTFGVWS